MIKCQTCGTDGHVLHGQLSCTRTERFTCPCCHLPTCTSCWIETTENEQEPELLCDACWCVKHDAFDLAGLNTN